MWNKNKYDCIITVDVNECHSTTDPCANGAECTNTVGSYRCTCSVGFQGQTCDSRKINVINQ